MVREGGFEPPTYRLGGGCSIQLSYRRIRPAMLNEPGEIVMPTEPRAATATADPVAMQNYSQFNAA